MKLATGPIRILGIDPGSRITGYGIIDSDGRQSVHVASGCIRTSDSGLPARLQTIFRGVRQLMAEYHPAAVAVEQVFMARNADSALKLGQARSAAICATFEAGAGAGAEVFEYAARVIKQGWSASGTPTRPRSSYGGGAPQPPEALQVDASDALAVALCHAHTRPLTARLAALPSLQAATLARLPGRYRARTAGGACGGDWLAEGVLAHKEPPFLVVDVGGVGYEIEAPMSTCFRLPAVGENVQLRTHLLVREDQHTLFGFATETERAVPRPAQGQRRGRKTALGVLSG